eukprot:7823429-Pyramimonas_sp.AAC.1
MVVVVENRPSRKSSGMLRERDYRDYSLRVAKKISKLEQRSGLSYTLGNRSREIRSRYSRLVLEIGRVQGLPRPLSWAWPK